MISITYLSSATGPWTPGALEDLLAECRANNAEAGVTGVLLYAAGSFVQTLEGPDPAVEAVMGRVRDDARHKNVEVLSREEIEERAFAGWSMGFHQPSGERLHAVPGFTDYLRTGQMEGAGTRSRAATTIHRLFRDQIREPLAAPERREG